MIAATIVDVDRCDDPGPKPGSLVAYRASRATLRTGMAQQPEPLSRRQRSLRVLHSIASWDDEGQPDVLQLPGLQRRVGWSDERSQELVSLLQELVDRRWIDGEPISVDQGTIDFLVRRITASGRDALDEAEHAEEPSVAGRVREMRRAIGSIQPLDLRDGLDRLLEAIQEEQDLSEGSRKAALDAAEDLVEAATLPPERRKRSRIVGAAHVFSELAVTAAAVATVWKAVEPLVVHYVLPHLH